MQSGHPTRSGTFQERLAAGYDATSTDMFDPAVLDPTLDFLAAIAANGAALEPELDEMLHLLVDSLVPGREWRWERRVHPCTLNGRQVDVRSADERVEVWECGLAHPDVLANAGLDGWSGLALGMGLDRPLMLRKGILTSGSSAPPTIASPAR